jgi:dihydrofolate synthase / folylpolyglutamate synthase
VSFEEAQAHLDSLGVDAMKSLAPSLHRIQAICEALDHPERSVPAIHVTGTNGKTSTARVAASLLTAAGLSVGIYTSPHLETIRERIARSGEPISEAEFGDLFDHLLPYAEVVEKQLDEKLSYFETLTAMFFLWAAEAPVDAMVVEVGLGGRWDATNVVPAPVAVITNVGLDHTGLLGMDKTAIAKEKAGVIKERATAVTAELDPAVLSVIESAADVAGAGVSRLGREFRLTDNRTAFGGRYLSVSTSARDYTGLFLPLHGSHQAANAATALEAVVRFVPHGSLDDEVVAEGLAATHVPGRLEVLRSDEGAGPTVVLDVAHNPDGMSALISSLLEAFAFERVVFVIGILRDKDHRGMLSELTRVPCTVIASEAKSVRSVPPKELHAASTDLGLDCTVVESAVEAVRRAVQSADPGDLVCVTGSHYVVGEVRSFLL